jgi:hypothetical protein
VISSAAPRELPAGPGTLSDVYKAVREVVALGLDRLRARAPVREICTKDAANAGETKNPWRTPGVFLLLSF